ncbi:MAG: histidinol phosphate aminotransferase apoenzyme [Chthonomonadaceae bacterium]|nr:histidinol phosphate aminotransferase apoenzyme [Chthonomonadaceae bacterium]
MTQTPAAELSEVAENITRLVPYVPGKPIEEVERELGITGIIKLASNENSLGPSPKAIEAVHKLAAKMHHYPDASSFRLRHAVATALDVAPETLVFGNGSDDIIHLLGVTFLEPGDEVIQGDPSFVRYEAAAILNNAPCHLVPLTADWVHDLDAMKAKVNARTRIIFITNPNNPTGTIVTRAALDHFLDGLPERVLVVLDEAYYEYATADPDYPQGLDYVREGRNVIVLRTFSKAYGLAGHRIGFGAMRPDIAAWLERTREPFNVNYMAQAAAEAAITDTDHVARTTAMNTAGKCTFYAAFEELGLPYTPTHANFVWVDVRRDCREVFNALLHKGVITRTSTPWHVATYLRVTIGTEAENEKFLTALREVLS